MLQPPQHVLAPHVLLQAWQQLSPEEQSAVRGLEVTAHQVEFAGTVERSVDACHASASHEVAGLAVLVGYEVVGFLVLKRGASAPSWADPDAAILSAMRIDLAWQGKGLGSATLRALPAWLRCHWPESPQLSLSVDEDNVPARRAYANAGFVDHGLRVQGRIGWVRYMSRLVGQANA